jgi:GT2 family glycosyltransferase
MEPIGGAQVIQAPRNYGCLGRFIASYAARGEYVLFQDNDTCVTKDTVLQLLLAAQDIPNSICSIDGWSFTADKTYTNGVKTLCYGYPIGGPGSRRSRSRPVST